MDKNELNQKELENVTGGAEKKTDYYCKNCGKVTSPKTKKYLVGETEYSKEVCSICEGEYHWVGLV